jgi:hypothetical protein
MVFYTQLALVAKEAGLADPGAALPQLRQAIAGGKLFSGLVDDHLGLAVIMDFAHRQHPDLTAEQAFSRELARNRKYDEVVRRFGEVKKVFYGI